MNLGLRDDFDKKLNSFLVFSLTFKSDRYLSPYFETEGEKYVSPPQICDNLRNSSPSALFSCGHATL